MSQTPNTNAPPGAPQESLEDLVYRSTLSESNQSVRKASPMVTIPATILSYAIAALFLFFLAKSSQAAQRVLRGALDIDLNELDAQKDEPPPPPPPPAPAAAASGPKVMAAAFKDKPPPPPPEPTLDTVPDVAPTALPTIDRSLQNAVIDDRAAGTRGTGGTGTGTGGVPGGTGTGPAGASVLSVMDLEGTPPVATKLVQPQFPAFVRAAKIYGDVVVEITMNAQGVPVSAKAISGPQPLRGPCEAAAMQCRFTPSLNNEGQPISARFRLTFQSRKPNS